MKVVCMHCDPENQDHDVSHTFHNQACFQKEMYMNMMKNLDQYNFFPDFIDHLPDFINPDTDFTPSLDPLDAIKMKRYWVKFVKPYYDGAKEKEITV